MMAEQTNNFIKYWIIGTNKLLHEIFNIRFSDEQIQETQSYVDDELVIMYCVEFDFEEYKGNTATIRISATSKDCLRFTVYEKMMYFMLLSNAFQSNDNGDYYISVRKLKEIRGLSGDSIDTYLCYEQALNRLENKSIEVIPKRSKGKSQYISCKLLSIKEKIMRNSRMSSFTYSFNALETQFISKKQKFTINFNPFAVIFKKSFLFQVSIHLIRLVYLNANSDLRAKNFSFQKILMSISFTNSNGVFENINYFEYLFNSKNKQSERLNRCYEETEIVLKQLVKNKCIKNYSISSRKTFKYLRDNEVQISIGFIR